MQNTKGRPMTEEELIEWHKAFTDIEECIQELYKQDDKSSKRKKRTV